MAAKFSTGLLVGILAGAGAVLAGSDKWRAARPLAKGALRAAVLGFDAARRASIRASEEFEDLLAETMHELETEKSAGQGGGGGDDR